MQRKVKRGAGITKQPLPKTCHPEAGEGTWKNKPQSVGEGLGVISLHGSMNPSPTARAQVQWEGLPGAGTYLFSCPLLGSSAGNHAKKLSPMDPITWSIPLPCVPWRERSCTWRGLHRVNWCFELHSTQMPLCCRDVAFTWMQKGASKHDLELMENDVLKEIFNCFGSVEPCATDWKQPYEYTLLKETPVAHGDVPPSSHHPCYSISKDKLCLGTLGLSSSRCCYPYGPFLVPHLLA